MGNKNQTTIYTTNDDQRSVPQMHVRDQREPTQGVHDTIPAFFRATCWLAERDGSRGYAPVGWNLASSVVCQIPDNVELDEWLYEIKILEKHAAADDRPAICSWFAAHYPKAMELIPARHRDQFAAGVRQAWEDDRLVL